MKLTVRLLVLLGWAIVFWNVENYFEDSPHFSDKTRAIAKVVMALADSTGEPPDIVGLCEVESAACLRRLVAQPALRKHGYRFVHYDSPDHRGIDCALLYRSPSRVGSLRGSRSIPIRDSLGVVLPTRSLLLVEFDSVAVIVCHLPSKRGGSAEADRRRSLALAALSRVCDSLAHLDSGEFYPYFLAEKANFDQSGENWGVNLAADRKIIVMGDFNDIRTAASDSVMAPMRELPPEDDGPPGTIKFQGRWEQIDRAFVSADSTGVTLRIAAPPFLLEPDKKFGGVKPRRTFIGPRYNGGLSDHLPIMITLPSSRHRR